VGKIRGAFQSRYQGRQRRLALAPGAPVVEEAQPAGAWRPEDLTLRVIAAGIESEEQLAFARRAGIAEAQGFLLGRPIEPEDFARCVVPRPRQRSKRR